MDTLIKRLVHEEDGATATEYGLITALIAVALIGVIGALRGEIAGLFGDAENDISGARN